MAFKKSRSRRTYHRPRRKTVDVVPWSYPRVSIDLGSGVTYGADNPFVLATPIVDGGAFNQIEQEVSQFYARLDSPRARGISFYGMVFESLYSWTDKPTSIFGSFEGLFELSIYSAICKIETKRTGAAPGLRQPTRLPNLVSPDEEDTGDILWRWLDHLPIVGGGFTAFQDFDAIVDTNTAGKFVAFAGWNPENTPNGAFWGGSGSNTFRQHRVKNRRFLDENHALYFVQNILLPIPPDDTFILAWDSYGVVKAKGR